MTAASRPELNVALTFDFDSYGEGLGLLEQGVGMRAA
jgi:hypothetical protein